MDVPDRPLVRTPLPSTDLGAAWEEHAAEFIAWARTPGHDSYWQFHRELFLDLVPPASRRTLDVGCGEGRVGRDLTAKGHRVVGIDTSAAMVAAARAEDPSTDVVRADAARLPFADATFDCIVSFMSLQDVEDYRGAIAEMSRVLEPAGWLCVAIVHPLNSAGTFENDSPDSPFIVEGSYLEPSYYADNMARDGLEITFVSAHRPLSAYFEALSDAGFLVESLREPAVPEAAIKAPRNRRWQRVPLFLHIRAVKS